MASTIHFGLRFPGPSMSEGLYNVSFSSDSCEHECSYIQRGRAGTRMRQSFVVAVIGGARVSGARISHDVALPDVFASSTQSLKFTVTCSSSLRSAGGTFSVGDHGCGLSDDVRSRNRARKVDRKRGTWTMKLHEDTQDESQDVRSLEYPAPNYAIKGSDESGVSISMAGQEELLRKLLAELISQEKYLEAAEIRDTLSLLLLKKRALEVAVMPRVQFCLGDVIIHKKYGYRGIIYGYDDECLAHSGWQKAMKVHLLPNGVDQPFYKILVDTRDRPGGMTTYVAQDCVLLEKQPQLVLHPLIGKYFVSFSEGRYIPRLQNCSMGE